MAATGSGIYDSEQAEKIAAPFVPREFPFVPSKAAHDFVRRQSGAENNSFQVDKVVSITTGIAELEKQSLLERVELEALERLKALQEEAYKQGYDLGRDEGSESAYKKTFQDVQDRMQSLEKVLSELEELRTELVRQHEIGLVQLVFSIAKKIAMTEIETKPEMIIKAIQAAAHSAQDDESVTVRLNPVDLEYVEKTRAQLGKEFQLIKRARLEASPEISTGGCVVVTNFGQVDATVEKRVGMVWQTLQEQLPKAAEVLGGDTRSGSGD